MPVCVQKERNAQASANYSFSTASQGSCHVHAQHPVHAAAMSTSSCARHPVHAETRPPPPSHLFC